MRGEKLAFETPSRGNESPSSTLGKCTRRWRDVGGQVGKEWDMEVTP